MANTKKITKKDNFLKLRELAQGNQELIDFIDNEIELIDKKNKSRLTKEEIKENEEITAMLIEELSKFEDGATISDLMNGSEKIRNTILDNGKRLSNQKINSIFIKLVDNKTIERIPDKKVNIYKVLN